MNTKFSLSVLIALSFVVTNVVAQESRVEVQAGRCSAIFFMLSETHQNQSTSFSLFQHFVGVFENLYVAEKKERTGSGTREDGIKRRELILKEFKESYLTRQASLKEEVVLCGAWAEGYRVQGEHYTYVPIIPKLIPLPVRADYEAFADTGWKKWMSLH